MSATAAGCGSSVGMNFGKEYYKMIVNAGYRGKVGAAAPKFTYTGQYNIRKDGVVELLTSGTIVFLEPKVIDLFMVGGGGAGGLNTSKYQNGYGGGGGAGGYTKTIKRVQVGSSPIQVTIGAGGLPGNSGYNGGATAWGANSVNGGSGNIMSGLGTATGQSGANGGSGGGGGVVSNSDFGTGGSDGNSGESGYPTSTHGGAGQGMSTREFGEAGGKLYAAGGGGGRYLVSNTPVASAGGSGGGGTGAWAGSQTEQYQAAAAGIANTGSGGGGGARRFYEGTGIEIIGSPGSGGSGIVCFREAQELPELAGTWVLNERLYNPETNIKGSFNFTTGPSTGTEYPYEGIEVPASTTGIMAYTRYNTAQNIYNFSNNSWYSRWKTIIIPAGATASDEFRAWLASNATKQ